MPDQGRGKRPYKVFLQRAIALYCKGSGKPSPPLPGTLISNTYISQKILKVKMKKNVFNVANVT